ncbi:integrin alpha-IIb isoform X4 [Balearica regulorum gibbericeps]|uniref:integrin alpha-IIb isoform X4 n=1 Tax=Balearica regulorum gibbericeps TaxID=100784 RepID=UPI003F5E8AD9
MGAAAALLRALLLLGGPCSAPTLGLLWDPPAMYEGPPGSYFGFALDFHMTEGRPSVVVGAPRANTSQPGVDEPGAVFLCSWPPGETPGETPCRPLAIDTAGDETETQNSLRFHTYKSRQWLGASVTSWDGKLVACAPLQHWNVMDNQHEAFRTPTGACYMGDPGLRHVSWYSPCRDELMASAYRNRHYEYDMRYCEIGFSAAVTRDGTLVLGAPGGYYFLGLLFAVKVDTILTRFLGKTPLWPTRLGPHTEERRFVGYEDGYRGYSVAVGEFDDNPKTKECVVGVPNKSNTRGEVEILSMEGTLPRLHGVAGEQVASYFGHAVAVADVDGDGQDDVLVGAPLYMARRPDGQRSEVGRLYLYLRGGQRPLTRPPQTLTGTQPYGRFAAAIASLGDLDKDGYGGNTGLARGRWGGGGCARGRAVPPPVTDLLGKLRQEHPDGWRCRDGAPGGCSCPPVSPDVAVGAPLGGDGGSGQVFIFRGQSEGLMPVPTQRLDSPFPGPAAFGFALRGATDLDDNGYPDLLVGAYGAAKVAVYQGQPVVVARTQLSVPDGLNPKVLACVLPGSGARVSCFSVVLCVSVTGQRIPRDIRLDAELQLDRLKPKLSRRVLLLQGHQSSWHEALALAPGTPPLCHNLTAYLRDEADFKDKLSPVALSLSLSLELPRGAPGLVLYGDTLVQAQTHIILEDCGKDNLCVPDLHLAADTPSRRLLIGAEAVLRLRANASNAGEGAFEAELWVQLPPGTHYQAARSSILGQEKLSCNPRKENGSHVVLCELGNPMKAGARITVDMELSVSGLEDMDDAITFRLQLRSKNSPSSTNTSVTVTVPVEAEAAMELRGNSLPATTVLPASWHRVEGSRRLEHHGIKVEHVYQPAGGPHPALPVGAGHRGGNELRQPARPERRAAGDLPAHGRSTPKRHPPSGAQGRGGAAGTAATPRAWTSPAGCPAWPRTSGCW